jgi:Flp pilus assembly secretin CpaC
MRILHFTLTAALMAAFVIGCSKHKSKPSASSHDNTKMQNLGVVEFTEGTPQHFALGGGKGCTITAKHTLGGIEVDFVIEATNANGVAEVWARPKISTVPGEQCAIGVEDVSVGLTPKWKTP